MRNEGATTTPRRARLVRVPVGELSEFDLPAVCVTTGSTDDVGFRPVRFTWIPRWTWLVLLCSAIPYLIVAGLTRKSATGELPFSEDAWRSYRTARRVGLASILVGAGAFFASLFALGNREPALGLLLMMATVLIPVATYWAYVATRGPRCRRVDDRHVELVLPSAVAAKQLEDHLYPSALDRFGGEAACAHHPDARATFVCARCGDYGCADCEETVREGARPLCTPCMDIREEHMNRRRARALSNMSTWSLASAIFGLFPGLFLVQGFAVLLGAWVLREPDYGTGRYRAGIGVTLGVLELLATLYFCATL